MDQASSDNFVSQNLASAPELHEQPSLGQLGALDQNHAPTGAEPSLDTGTVQHLVPPLIGSQGVQYQTSAATTQGQASSFTGLFTTANVNAPAVPSTYETSSYREVLGKLNTLWSDRMKEIESLGDEHWKSQEFPLARIKKIMRMDEDVKMISTEVPVMFSKILEVFITELTMRSWLHTEESKRRTVQRSDIAMAITKNDMFDFLIDIVPREEIQLKTKSQKDIGLGENLQLLPPDVLQLYIQQVINQTLASMTAGGEEREEGDEDSATATAVTLQQLQLLQQLVQLQQAQQDQQLQQQQQQGGGLDQLQHMTESPSTASASQYSTAPMDVQILQSSASVAATPSTSRTSVLESSSVGSALEQLAKNSSNNNATNSTNMTYGQHALSHVNHPDNLHHLHEHPSLSQQQQSTGIFTSTQEPHITTVVIPQPLDSSIQPAQSSILDTSFQLHTQDASQEQNLRRQLESLATEQFIGHQLPVELSTTVAVSGSSSSSADASTMVGTEGERVGFQPLPAGPGPESESVSSPITGLSPNTELTGVVFTNKTY